MATAVAAAIAYIAANAAVISLAISVVSVGFALYSAKKSRSAGATSQAERKQILRSGTAPKTFLYGETISSGVLIYAGEQAGDQDEGEQLHMVLSHAGTPIDRIEEVFFNDEPAANFSSFTTIAHYPQGRTTADPYLTTNAPQWQSDMIGRDFAWMRLSLTFNQDAFPTGVPNVTARKFGRRVQDPRTEIETPLYSENPALCLLDYLRNHPSLQYEDDELLLDTFIQAANICDEDVSIYDGTNIVGTEKRYTISAEVDFNEDPSDVIDAMLAACAGEPIRVGGRFGIHVGAYYGPTLLTLTQDDVIGAIAMQPEASQQDAYNTVRGVYNSKKNNFTETDYPEVKFNDWVTEDGGEVVENLDLRFCTSSSQAQRVADITARRARFGMIVEIPCNYRGMNYPPGCSFRLSLSQIALTNIEFKVLAWAHAASDGVTLICRREQADFYGQRLGQDITLPPLVNLPDSGVAQPSSVSFNTVQVGEVVQGQLEWQNTSFRIASTEVLLYRVPESGDPVLVRTASVPFPGTTLDLSGQLQGNYRADLVAVAVTGQRSATTSINIVISAPAIPDSVTVNRSNWSMELIPNYSAGNIPVNTLFEFTYLADPASFIAGVPTFDEDDRTNANAVIVHRGSSLNHTGLTPDRYQHYWVRAVNAYGASDYFYVQTGTTRESGLVTTVLERLVAIEVQSQNWSPDATGISTTGYKLFSNFTPGPVTLPDGTELQNPDGLLVAQNAVIRGHIVADTGTFSGTLNGADGTFTGTIEAGQIVGDVVSAITKGNVARTASTTGTGFVQSPAFGTVSVVNARGRARTMQINLQLNVGFNSGGAFAIAGGRIVVAGTWGTFVSQELQTPAKPGDSATSSADSLMTISIPIPANTTGFMTIYVQARRVTTTRSANVFARVSAPTTNNVWSALLLTNGGDLA